MLARTTENDSMEDVEEVTVEGPPRPPEPPIEELELERQPRKSDLVNTRMRVIRDGREFVQITTMPKPGRAIFCIIRLIAPDGKETYQIGTRRVRGRPPGNGKA